MPVPVDSDIVLFYESEFYMFSNFSAFAIRWDGEFWMTTEHIYQAEKFEDPEIRHKIRMALSAHDAKKIAKLHDRAKRSDWAKIKLAVMERILRTKLEQHSYVREMLLATGSRELVEDSPKDSFWGRGPDHLGHNHLGKLWMKLRSEIYQESL